MDEQEENLDVQRHGGGMKNFLHKKKILFDAQEKAKAAGFSEDEMKKAVYEYSVAKRDAKKVISRAKEAETKKCDEDLAGYSR